MIERDKKIEELINQKKHLEQIQSKQDYDLKLEIN